MPKGSAIAVGFEWWGPEFGERTNGRYKVELYPSNTLVPLPAALDMVKGGVCEIVLTSTSFFANDFPLATVTGLPTLTFHRGKTTEDAYVASWDALDKLYNKFPAIQAEFKDFKLIKPFEIDAQYLVSKKKLVRVPSDLKGMKVGGASGDMADMVKAYGAVGVFQVPPQAYLNMDKGVTDAAILAYGMTGPYKIYEIAKYNLKQDFRAGTLILLMNWDAWNAIPAEYQEIFNESFHEAAYGPCLKGMVDVYYEGERDILNSDMQIIQPTIAESLLWDQAAEIAFQTWLNTAHGLNAENPEAVLAEWKSLVQAYRRTQ
jgi:TRAP-type C4-dicarboxylate transport system substrate-binding protein